MRQLRTLWRLLRVLLHLLAGTLLALLIAPFQRPDRPHPTPRIVLWWLRRLCHLLGLQIRVRGDIPNEPHLLVANHISWLDIPVLGSLMLTSFISKQEVRNWPLIGWLAARACTLFIRRGAGQTDQLKAQMQAKLDLGNQVLLFPEGTTGNGEEVGPFFPRLLAIAQETGQPIQPVALRFSQNGELSRAAPYIGDDILMPHLWRVLSQDSIEVEVCFTQPLHINGQSRKELALQARNQIVAALNTLN